MKQHVRSSARALLAAALVAAGLGACTGMGYRENGTVNEGDVREEVVGEAHQTLVYYNGQWVPACSVNYSRCRVSTSATNDFEECAWSVKNPGTENWYQGTCDAGYVCQQQGIEARCISGGGGSGGTGGAGGSGGSSGSAGSSGSGGSSGSAGAGGSGGSAGSGGSGGSGGGSIRTLHCEDRGTHIRVNLTGSALGGGLVGTPLTPSYLEYGADITGESDGWTVPYANPSATRRDRVSYNGSGNVSLDLEPEVTNFNLCVRDTYPNPDTCKWFRLDDETWDVSGICEVRADGAGKWKLYRTTSVPGGGTQPVGSIMCERTSSNLVVRIRGPVQSRTVGGRSNSLVSNPSAIQYGSNLPYPATWGESSLASNGRTSAAWTADDATYVLNLPRDASEFNFYLKGASGGSWFDLLPRSDNAVVWTVGGDCFLNGSLIYQQ